ncbi:MAG: Sodium-dependent transporter [uncultured Caballeronia sp.]|nr:MAG: Sodium-dependent transporter [uncultured Caballeronia sp.]
MQYVRPCFVRLAAIEKLQPPMRPISLFLCPRVLTQSGTAPVIAGIGLHYLVMPLAAWVIANCCACRPT